MARIIPGTSAIVDPACPIDWSHPLNIGLTSEWAIPPNSGWRGGQTFRDLVRGGRNAHDGTLDTAITPSGWRGGAAPGSYGRVQFDGSSKISLPAGIWPSSDFTVVVDFLVTSTSAFQGLLSSYTSDGNSFEVFVDGTTRLMAGCYGANSFTTAGSIATNTPYNLIVSVSGAVNNLGKTFLNGVNKAGSSPTLTFTSRSLATTIGKRSTGTFPLANGSWVSRVSIYNRGLVDAECKALYQETKAGNPNRWNWLETGRFWSIPVVIATGNRRRRILCAGSIA